MPDIKIGDEIYSEVAREAVIASKGITDAHKALGKPTTPFTDSGQKLMNMIIAVWEDLYPIERKVWFQERGDHLSSEKSITQQVSQKTGRSLASYPYPIYKMMKVVFPEFKAGERKNCIKLVKKWPMFRMVNKI